jgi:Abnormal spindle-like microcephaly-assoc'd, ASPM-SPD-2-Hydin
MSRNRTAAARTTGRTAARVAAAGLALAAPLAIAGAALSGTAQATTIPSYALSVSTHSLAFGSVNTGAHLAKSVTVTNTGSKPVQPVKLKSGSTEFKVAGSCANASLAPATSCKYTVTFAPTTGGAVTGNLQVLSVQGTPAQNVALSGTGVVQQMQAYNYLYTFTNPPVINNVAAPQSFQGTGFAPAGTYTFGQTIPVYDTAGLNQIGTYRIGTVTDQPLDPAQLNTVVVNTYTWGTNHYIVGTGLTSTTATGGLGSERGTVNGNSFNDHNPAIFQMHF